MFTIVFNPKMFTLLPCIKRNFFDDAHKWGEAKRPQMFNPAFFMGRFVFTLSDMYLQSMLRNTGFANVANLIRERVNEYIYEGGLRLESLVTRGYSIIHDKGHSLSSRQRCISIALPPQYYLLSIPQISITSNFTLFSLVRKAYIHGRIRCSTKYSPAR